ncbi:PREDICTED: repressor of [Prunus dulcis]|uniref:PREDICTED: repressor of n=1 Tax=Prunus dulcis TaxID=3755 RepID=A0A5E4G6W9_PRUDU|nr:PREDICTED: repressor of [Prunus dulcis]
MGALYVFFAIATTATGSANASAHEGSPIFCNHRVPSTLTEYEVLGIHPVGTVDLLLNDFFSHLNLGGRTINGCLEAYSCKHTGSDKKLSLSLENEILDYLGKSSDTDSSSPAEFLLTRSSRKTLIYLVLTLYHLYPDYDFSAVNAHQFFTEESWDSFKQMFDTYMFEASKEWTETNEGSSLLEALYKALDEVVRLAECEVYSYVPDSDADPFLERGAVWSFNFFFYNRKLKRVVSFRLSCESNLVADGLCYEEDGEIFDGMDI